MVEFTSFEQLELENDFSYLEYLENELPIQPSMFEPNFVPNMLSGVDNTSTKPNEEVGTSTAIASTNVVEQVSFQNEKLI